MERVDIESRPVVRMPITGSPPPPQPPIVAPAQPQPPQAGNWAPPVAVVRGPLPRESRGTLTALPLFTIPKRARALQMATRPLGCADTWTSLAGLAYHLLK